MDTLSAAKSIIHEWRSDSDLVAYAFERGLDVYDSFFWALDSSEVGEYEILAGLLDLMRSPVFVDIHAARLAERSKLPLGVVKAHLAGLAIAATGRIRVLVN